MSSNDHSGGETDASVQKQARSQGAARAEGS